MLHNQGFHFTQKYNLGYKNLNAVHHWDAEDQKDMHTVTV